MSWPFAPLLSRLVQKRFDSPDGLEGLGSLVQPTLQLIPTPDELALLAQERLFTWGSSQAGVAGQFGFLTVRNNGLNTLCTVERVVLSFGAAADCLVIYQASPTTGATGFSRDTRQLTSGQVKVGLGTDAAVASAAPWAWVESIPANISTPLSIPPILLAPLSVLTVVMNSTNQACRFSVAWRERILELPETAQL